MESKKSLQSIRYQKELKKLLNNNLIDIIIFGSTVKGSLSKDIDLALIIKTQQDIADIKKKIRNIAAKNVDLQIITIEAIYSPLWLTLIKEGFSIAKNKFLHEIYNIKPSVVYKYSLNKLNNVQKVQFERGLKQVLGNKGKLLTRSVVIIPLTMKNEMIEFLKNWNIYYESHEYELLPVLRKEEFL